MSARFNAAMRHNEGQKEATTERQTQRLFPPSPPTNPFSSPPWQKPPWQKKRQRHEAGKQVGVESSSDLHRSAASPIDGLPPMSCLMPASPQPDSTPRLDLEFLFKLGARKSSVIFNSTETLQTCPTNCSLPTLSSFQGPTARMVGDWVMLSCKPEQRHRLITRSTKHWRVHLNVGFVIEIHQTYGHHPRNDLETTYYVAMVKNDGRAFSFTLPLSQLPAVAAHLDGLYHDFMETKKTARSKDPINPTFY